jgi:hypothetical protein
MISTKEAHPPVRALVVVRTGASKVKITSPAKRGSWICSSLTEGSRSRQFGIGTRPLNPGKRANRTCGFKFLVTRVSVASKLPKKTRPPPAPALGLLSYATETVSG